jgi:predicted nucleic acid-binding protein
VRIVVADTSPIHYLVLIGEVEILPALFEKIVIPTAVRAELAHAGAPEAVRKWMQTPPPWLELHTAPVSTSDAALENLDEGERAALTLAASLNADLVLMDDRQGVRVARGKGFRVVGTLRVLQLAAERGLLDWADAFERLKRTKFRYRQEIIDQLLAEPGDQ